jgi:hypothetical protein
MGESGPFGEKGTPGLQGPPGPSGQDGISGPVGPLGDSGLKGTRGRSGKKGPPGDPGEIPPDFVDAFMRPDDSLMMADEALNEPYYPPAKNEDLFGALRRVASLVDDLFSPLGDVYFPARTCADLARDHGVKEDGYYYIDPNGGHWRDAVKVKCRFAEQETCVEPQVDEYKRTTWIGKPTQTAQWFSNLANIPERFTYRIEPNQLLFLQLASESAYQTITLPCLKMTIVDNQQTSSFNDSHSVRLLSDDEHLVTANDPLPLFRYDVLKDDCRFVSDRNSETVLQLNISRPRRLPIRDISIPVRNWNLPGSLGEFGVKLGSVCYRGVSEENLAAPAYPKSINRTMSSTKTEEAEEDTELQIDEMFNDVYNEEDSTPSPLALVKNLISSTMAWLTDNKKTVV